MVLPDPVLTILLTPSSCRVEGKSQSCPSFPGHQLMAVTGNSHVDFEAITTYPSNTLKVEIVFSFLEEKEQHPEKQH